MKSSLTCDHLTIVSGTRCTRCAFSIITCSPELKSVLTGSSLSLAVIHRLYVDYGRTVWTQREDFTHINSLLLYRTVGFVK